jgi:bifunctional non-homologous end joining protein LigD
MSLRDYARKRKFTATPEPAHDQGRARKAGRKEPIFVVQLHHASHRHYDFRLEVDGALKSWAVPKGPSLRVGERRLAVEVEDHPLAYADFEGDIPKGNYGAGHVQVFDKGTWQNKDEPLQAIAAGKLDFVLHGGKLKGGWKLVRTKKDAGKPQWLLFKRDDEYAMDAEADDLIGANWQQRAAALPGARRKPLPTPFTPQLCGSREAAPRGDQWLHEIKWDGYRLLAELDAGKATLRTRNGLDWTHKFPEIARALQALPVRKACIDGELVVLDREGRSDFSLLQHALKAGAGDELRYLLFDLPAIDGVDLTQAKLIDRKNLLEQLLAGQASNLLAYSRHIIGHGEKVFEASKGQGVEGIICKRLDATYVQARSDTWIKVKHEDSDEFVIVGYTKPKGSRTDFGALLMAKPEQGRLRYVGRVGTGYGDAALRDIFKKLSALAQQEANVVLPAHTTVSARDVHWVRPKLVAEVAYRGWGKEGLLRQAAFKGLREDKSLADLQPESTMDVKITSPDRVVYKSPRITKAEVADYYRAVAPWMLIELANRPLSLLRCPDGAEGTCFFQKHYLESLGGGVKAIKLKQKSGAEDYIYVDDAQGLLALVQMNTLEFHPWGSRTDAPEKPDRMVFDLDPADGIDWKTVVAAARDVRARLREAGLESFVRVTGGKGLHVVAPFARGPSWDQLKQFCEAFANAMAAHRPQSYVATMSKVKRTDKIFIDWLRNTRGATSVTSWSLRARAGAPVAVPVRWEDLGRIRASAAFDMHKAARRAASLAADPWAEMYKLDQKLPTAVDG